MTCVHCCGAENLFNQKQANKDLKKYRKKGPNKTTKKLLAALFNEEINNLSHLDIGGGIGAIQHELLKKGISKTTDIDASTAYIEKAKELMQQNGTTQQMEFIFGDFIDFHQHIDKHDIVTLERVVCCYPHVTDLINNSTSKANKYYALVYPMDGFLSKSVNKLAHLYLKLKKNPFRTYVHSEKMMHELICKNGFENIYYGNVFPWKIAVYKRVN